MVVRNINLPLKKPISDIEKEAYDNYIQDVEFFLERLQDDLKDLSKKGFKYSKDLEENNKRLLALVKEYAEYSL